MEIKRVIKINKKFGGALINRSNLDFDLSLSNRENNVFRKNAYIIRGIINGHPFLDGNKRTALYLISNNFKKEGYKCDKKRLTQGMINIAKDNINQIEDIEKRLRKWCSKR